MAEGVCCECQHYKRQSCRVIDPVIKSSRKIRGYPAVDMSDTCEKWEPSSYLEQAELRGEQETEEQGLRSQLAKAEERLAAVTEQLDELFVELQACKSALKPFASMADDIDVMAGISRKLSQIPAITDQDFLRRLFQWCAAARAAISHGGENV